MWAVQGGNDRESGRCRCETEEEIQSNHRQRAQFFGRAELVDSVTIVPQ